MDQIIYYAGFVSGILVLVVGFGFHWIGQLITLINSNFARRIGILESDNLAEYEVYDNAIAIADVTLGWTYGIAGAGLIFGTIWSYRLAWLPGVVLLYHSLCFWFWTRNQKKAGYNITFTKNPTRTVWFIANLGTGILTIAVAWTGSFFC